MSEKAFSPVAFVGMASLAIAAIAGAGAYMILRNGSAGSSFSASSPVSSFSSNSSFSTSSAQTDADGLTETLAFPSQIFEARSGAVLALTAALSSTAKGNKIVWSSSDVSKVFLSTSSTASGSAVTATLVSVYEGAVTVTATAEADSRVKKSVKLYCDNALSSFDLQSVYCWYGAYQSARVLTWESGDELRREKITKIDNSYMCYVPQDGEQSDPAISGKWLDWITLNNAHIVINYRVFGADPSRVPVFSQVLGEVTLSNSAAFSHPIARHYRDTVGGTVLPIWQWDFGDITFSLFQQGNEPTSYDCTPETWVPILSKDFKLSVAFGSESGRRYADYFFQFPQIEDADLLTAFFIYSSGARTAKMLGPKDFQYFSRLLFAEYRGQ